MAYERKTEEVIKEGLVVKNVPYNQHDYPCDCGCGELMKSQSTGVILRVKFLLEKHMTENNLTEFDYKDYHLIETEFKEWLHRDESGN
ncbi:hypothetical protein ORM92_22880 [Bacillus cereus]|uniref:hypothetical protein n=1 Tax=Bacillus cereus TaxID=1396 RepID=UPI002AC1CADA|nr:hypothetical protein [Bacillus cereus]MDZ4533936.1 hypothetical protein [Bacillus cereus]